MYLLAVRWPLSSSGDKGHSLAVGVQPLKNNVASQEGEKKLKLNFVLMDTLDTWLTCTRVSTPDLSENSPQILVSCPQTNIKLHSQSIAIGKISLVLKYLRILSEKKKILVLAIYPPKINTYFYIFQFNFPLGLIFIYSYRGLLIHMYSFLGHPV